MNVRSWQEFNRTAYGLEAGGFHLVLLPRANMTACDRWRGGWHHVCLLDAHRVADSRWFLLLPNATWQAWKAARNAEAVAQAQRILARARKSYLRQLTRQKPDNEPKGRNP